MNPIRRSLSALLPLVVLLAVCAGAQGAERWASPAGSGTTCTQVAPCSILTAVNSAITSADPIVIGAGTYGSPVAPIVGLEVPWHFSTVRGESPFARPTIYATAAPGGSAAFDPGQYATVSDLNIVSVYSPTTFYGFRESFGTVSRLAVSGVAGDAICAIYADISNTSCSTSAPGANAISAISGGGPGDPVAHVALDFVNVSATAADGYGMTAGGNSSIDLDIAIANSVFKGPTYDIFASSNHVDSADTDIDIWSSNFSGVYTSDAGVTVTANTSANNQSAQPQFVNEATGNLRPLPTSPTVDAGDDTSIVGPYDGDGTARIYGSHVDIGAYEWSLAPVVPPRPEATEDPIITKFKFAKKKFRAAKKGASIQRAKNAKKQANKGFGSTFSFTSTENGTVRFTLYKWSKKKGETKFRRLPGIDVQSLVRGDRKFWFNGRWHGKKLATGTYQLRASPVRKGSSTLPEVKYWPTVPGPSFTIKK